MENEKYTENIRIKVTPELKFALKELAKGKNFSKFIRELLTEKIIEEKFKNFTCFLGKDKKECPLTIVEAMERKRVMEEEIKELEILIKKITEKETLKILQEKMNKIKKIICG